MHMRWLAIDDEAIHVHRSRLPHRQARGASYFVTCCLADTWRRRMSQMHENADGDWRRCLLAAWRADRRRDRARTGRRYLARPAIAHCIEETLVACAGDHYAIRRYVIMPDHVHLLITAIPQGHETQRARRQLSLSTLLGRWKGVSARRANALLERSGPFWQRDSFDHQVRSEFWFRVFARYIDLNPVRAGLCQHPWQWPFSSAAHASSAA